MFSISLSGLRCSRLMTICFVALLGTLSACGRDNEGAGKAAKAKETPAAGTNDENRKLLKLTPDEERRANLKFERLALGRHHETAAMFGTVEANRDRFARVLPPVAGRIVRVTANLGDHVEQGTVLATLESPEFGDVRATYLQARIEVELTKKSYERARSLAAGGSIAQKEALRAKSDYEKAQAVLVAVTSKLGNLGVAKDTAAGDGVGAALAVTSPLTGTLLEKTAVLGEYAQSYQPLFTIGDLSSVWIETNLYDRDLGEVAVGALANVTVNAYPGQSFAGRVTYISSLLDKDTHTVKARVEVANPDGRLKPGMFADVLIDKGGGDEVLRIPDSALVLMQGQMTAFVKEGGGFQPRPVRTGERTGGQITIAAGLEPGDEVVVEGVFALKARLLKSQIGDAD
jgi:cobalt-zinc-cadmium efflux system membrane fusion protein